MRSFSRQVGRVQVPCFGATDMRPGLVRARMKQAKRETGPRIGVRGDGLWGPPMVSQIRTPPSVLMSCKRVGSMVWIIATRFRANAVEVTDISPVQTAEPSYQCKLLRICSIR